MLRGLVAVVVVLFVLPAQAKEYVPHTMAGIDVEERLGESVDPGLIFTDHTGTQRTLGELLAGDVPVLLTLNYYRCKMLCNIQLNALSKAIRGAKWVPGDQYRIVTISIDPNEGWELGRDKRDSYKKMLGMGAAATWCWTSRGSSCPRTRRWRRWAGTRPRWTTGCSGGR